MEEELTSSPRSQRSPIQDEIEVGEDVGEKDPDSEGGVDNSHADPWFPWKSRIHFQLTVFYHGSLEETLTKKH